MNNNIKSFLVSIIILCLISSFSYAEKKGVSEDDSWWSYVGDWTGLQSIEELDYATAEDALKYAQMSKSAFLSGERESAKVPGYRRMTQSELPEAVHQYFNDNKLQFEDSATGLKGTIFVSEADPENSPIIVAFTGSDIRMTWRAFLNFMAAAYQTAGGVPTIFNQANDIVVALQEMYPEREVILTGTSLGGGLATYAASMHDLKAVVFNSIGLGGGAKQALKEKHGDAVYEKALGLITHINLENDALTAWMPEVILRNQLGKIYLLPQYTEKKWATESHMIEPVIDNLEYYLEHNADDSKVDDEKL